MTPGRVAHRRLFVLLVAVLAACGSDQGAALSTAPGTDVSTATSTATAPSATETDATTPDTPAATSPASTAPVTNAPATNSSVVAADDAGTNDPADSYLGGTDLVYERTLADGRTFVVRVSTASYASVFGLTWSAPTGTADTCLGDHAAFFGVPGDIGDWGSAFVTSVWQDDPGPMSPPVLQMSMRAGTHQPAGTQFLVLRTDNRATELILASADRTELDRAPVTNGIAMVIDPRGQTALAPGDRIVTTLDSIGQQLAAPSPLSWPTTTARPECGPGEPPQQPLPAAGDQPSNPAAAEAQIRERHALLVDQSIDASDKPLDLLDDRTGIDAAVAAMRTGPYADVAATATYVIDDFVFTTPEEAWFRYAITTSSSTFADRFGRAVFNGTVWQITRATICQDLALAAAPCRPEPTPVELPPDPAWTAAWQEWVNRAMLYSGNDGCPPLSQC